MPKWVEKPKDSQLEEGKPGYLHCLSRASLKPTVNWFRNGFPISEVSTIIGGGTAMCYPVEQAAQLGCC